MEDHLAHAQYRSGRGTDRVVTHSTTKEESAVFCVEQQISFIQHGCLLGVFFLKGQRVFTLPKNLKSVYSGRSVSIFHL